MKTLIFNGSPRPRGDTMALIGAFLQSLEGKADIIHCYTAKISPCVDCRACRERFCCAIQDEMQSVYRIIHEADRVVIASPIYYSELTGRLLDVLSRLQPGYYARLRGEAGFADQRRKGGILLAGGGDGGPEPAIARARVLLRAMGCKEILPPVMSLQTNHIPAAEDADALRAAGELARTMSRLCSE